MKKKLFAYGWIGLVLLFLYLPILILAVYSFTNATMVGQLRGFSLANYITLFTTEELRKMILGTVLLALVVSVIATILGTLGAIGSFYSKKMWQTGIELVNQIPVVNADVVTGFSICILLIVFFKIDKNTYIPLVIGQTALCAPFVYLSVMPRLKEMDPALYEAVLDLGGTPAQALIKVVLWELLPGILSGFMTSVTLSLDDYFIATYTKPAVFDTISTYVVNATKGAQTQTKTALWALSTVIFLIVVIAVALMNFCTGSRKERTMKQ
jgi:spermidine/putrescine transport system permease protein